MEGMVHRARVVRRSKGERNAQGERPAGVPEPSAWIPARLMERGSVEARSRTRPGQSPAAKIGRGYELLLDPEDELGAAVPPPIAGWEVETECPILGSPTIELSGEPEVLNDGEEVIGYLCHADKPKARR